MKGVLQVTGNTEGQMMKMTIFTLIAVLFSMSAHANMEFLELSTGRTTQPVGHYYYCKEFPNDCSIRSEGEKVDLDREKMAVLNKINRNINKKITAKTDQEAFGVPEYWTADATTGDCEDFALAKRKQLLSLGWPASALLISVVRQANGDIHAVLIVRATDGDYAMDLLSNKILLWKDTPYDYVKIQSPYNSGWWVDIVNGSLDYYKKKTKEQTKESKSRKKRKKN